MNFLINSKKFQIEKIFLINFYFRKKKKKKILGDKVF